MNKLFCILAIGFFSTNLQAQTYGSQYNEFYNSKRFSYNFVELSYFDGEVDTDGGGDVDTDGLELDASYRLTGENNEFFVFGSYADLEADFSPDVDASLLELGGGYINDSNQDYDLFATISYLRGEVDDDKDNGFGLSGGARKKYDENIEIRGILNYQDINDSAFFIDLEGDYFFSDNLAGGVTLSIGDVSGFTIRGRYYFDKHIKR